MIKTISMVIAIFIVIPMAAKAESSGFDRRFLLNTDFFQNSVRRDINKTESRSLLRSIYQMGPDLYSICSAFSVKNSKGKFVVGTARHCLGYQATESCKTGKIMIRPATGFPVPFIAECEKVVAGSDKDDLILLEMKIRKSSDPKSSSPEKIQKMIQSYSLAAYRPPGYFGLRMLGFPGDRNREGKPTATENCTVMPTETQSVWATLPYEERRQIELNNSRVNNQSSDLEKELRQKISVEIGLHNCSVYGGNSGGPMILENTQDVVAIPFAYWPQYYKTIPSKYGTEMELTSGFVRRNRIALEEASISISESIIRISPKFSYLKSISKSHIYQTM